MEDKEIAYQFVKEFLVEPMDDIMVKKEITEPVFNEDKDQDDKFRAYETETKEVEVPSSFRRAKLIALPFDYDGSLKIGDSVIYPRKYAIDFDIIPNTQLVKPYDVIAFEK